jgi:hypothetical protein
MPALRGAHMLVAFSLLCFFSVLYRLWLRGAFEALEPEVFWVDYGSLKVRYYSFDSAKHAATFRSDYSGDDTLIYDNTGNLVALTRSTSSQVGTSGQTKQTNLYHHPRGLDRLFWCIILLATSSAGIMFLILSLRLV